MSSPPSPSSFPEPDLLATAAYDYELPDELIASQPVAHRDGSRLMVVRAGKPIRHGHTSELPDELRPGDLLVRNAARVVAARLIGRKPTGGAVELLALSPVETTWEAAGPSRFLALGRASKPIRRGVEIELAGGERVAVEERLPDGRLILRNDSPLSLVHWLDAHGTTPLPPYIRRAREQRREAVDDAQDRQRYQTVYAQQAGAVAAPTAGLHFTEATFDALAAHGVEVVDLALEVGAGTFRPIDAERLDEHAMHREVYQLPEATAESVNAARAAGRRVIALGTTAFRALEDQAARGVRAAAGRFETQLYVRPGAAIRWVGGLVTNFHLPRSSLLVLVSAFAGYEVIRAAYRDAVALGYRFYSYGDAMLLLPAAAP